MDSDAVGLGWGQGSCISNKVQVMLSHPSVGRNLGTKASVSCLCAVEDSVGTSVTAQSECSEHSSLPRMSRKLSSPE